MVTEQLFEKILSRVGKTEDERHQAAHARYLALNEKLEEQLKSQAMTAEILNKACTL